MGAQSIGTVNDTGWHILKGAGTEDSAGVEAVTDVVGGDGNDFKGASV